MSDALRELFKPVKSDDGARGRFDAKSRTGRREMFTDRHRYALTAGAAAVLGITVLHQLAECYKF